MKRLSEPINNVKNYIVNLILCQALFEKSQEISLKVAENNLNIEGNLLNLTESMLKTQ